MRIAILLMISALTAPLIAQNDNTGRISGSFSSNVNFFMKDTAIHASGTPQYEYQLYSADTWLNVQYNRNNFEAGVRLDAFNNSYLFNPNGGSYTAIGIGNWFVSQQIKNLNIKGGYIYDQIGSGIIYRAYEERPLAIDNALLGVRLAYDISPDWHIKAFTGKQKVQFDSYKELIKGISLEGFITKKEASEGTNWSLAPGIGMVARTLDNETVEKVNNVLKYYTGADTISSYKHNTYAFSLYNTLSAGPISWYVEGAYKTPDIMYSPLQLNAAGNAYGLYVHKAGTVLYTSVSYAKKGLGITLEGKRTENFSFKTDPSLLLNRGLINYIPSMSRINTYRLTSRYNPATQFMGELAGQLELRYRLSDQWSFLGNYSLVNDLESTPLYRELYVEGTVKPNKKDQLIFGLQRQEVLFQCQLLNQSFLQKKIF